MIRVLIADDHVLLLDGLAQALDAIPDLEVVATAADGSETVDIVRTLRPDVLLVDLEMPGLSGLDALEEIVSPPPTLVVTMHADGVHRQAARDAGAVGLLSKSTPLPVLAAAVRAAARGKELWGSRSDDLLEEFGTPLLDDGAASLTEREREVLGLLAEGVSSTQELADRLFISQKTVKNHLASIYEKLGISDRAQAVVEAVRLGLARK